jgi:hypothetical protein
MVDPSAIRRLALLALLATAAGCGGGASSPAPASPTTPAVVLVTPPPGFPTGTFTKDITAEDFAAANVTHPTVGNNVGRMTLTLGPDGRYTAVLDSGGATQVNPVFRGTYRVDGTDLALTTEFPPEYAGAVAQYAWRLDDAGLWTTITRSSDPLEVILAKAIDAEPWVPVP